MERITIFEKLRKSISGDATDDVTCYEKAWEMSKRRSHKAQRHWGQFYYLRKDYKECIPHFEKSLSINPLQMVIWSRLGYAALQIENWQTAATAYRRYTALEPDSFEAWNNLGQAYIQLGNKRQAHQALAEALKCNFENWKVWENFLVTSCDILHFPDVIRAYHKLLDLKDKYLNVGVLKVLVKHVFEGGGDHEGQAANRYIKKTRELLGRITALHPSEGCVWELYAAAAPIPLLQAQRLQKAFRGYTQSGWEKDPENCQRVLKVARKLAHIALSEDIQPKDSSMNSIRLNISSALATTKRQDWEVNKGLVDDLENLLEKITEKMKSVSFDDS